MPLGAPQLMETEDIYMFDRIAELLAYPGNIFNIFFRISEPGDEHETDPDLYTLRRKAFPKIYSWLKGPACNTAIRFLIAGFNIKKAKVNVPDIFICIVLAKKA